MGFDGAPVTFVCPYDAAALPATIIDHAENTHPEILSCDGVADSASYADPHDFCARLNGATRLRDGRPAAELAIEPERLAAVRRVVRGVASSVGLGEARVDDLVLAVHEVATNALLHGAEPVLLRVWCEREELVCEVIDCGGGISDPIAGQLNPEPWGPGAAACGRRACTATPSSTARTPPTAASRCTSR